MSKRTSRKPKRLTRTSSTFPFRAAFIVDTYDGAAGGHEFMTAAKALAKARAHGKSDRPAVVWKHLGNGLYAPYRVVVEGRTFSGGTKRRTSKKR